MSAGQRVFPKASRWRNFVGNPTFWRCVKYGGWLPVAVFVTHNVYSVGNIGGPSMMPTFNPDYYSSPLHSDVVLLERWQVKGSLPFLGQRYRRGDVVTLWSPVNPETLVTKRIIALEGDVVTPLPPSAPAPFKIPPGHAWIEGDSFHKTLDSNTYGPVPLSLINARVTHIIWPPGRISPVPDFEVKSEGRVRKKGGAVRTYG